MLKLIKCEFWKLKRKRLLYALMSLSLFFPLILAYMAKAGTGADTTEHYLQTRFDYVYTMMLGYGLVFLLPSQTCFYLRTDYRFGLERRL